MNVGRKPSTEFKCRAFEVEREFNFHAPPKSTCPATAVVLSVESPAESQKKEPDKSSKSESLDWPMPDDSQCPQDEQR